MTMCASYSTETYLKISRASSCMCIGIAGCLRYNWGSFTRFSGKSLVNFANVKWGGGIRCLEKENHDEVPLYRRKKLQYLFDQKQVGNVFSHSSLITSFYQRALSLSVSLLTIRIRVLAAGSQCLWESMDRDCQNGSWQVINDCLFTICNKSQGTHIRNIIQIHNSVLWEWQYSMEHFTNQSECREYFVKYCQSQRTLSRIWEILWTRNLIISTLNIASCVAYDSKLQIAICFY